MSYTHVHTSQVDTGDRTIRKEISCTAGQRVGVSEEPVPDSTTDMFLNVPVDVSEIKSFYMMATQDLTIETNSGSSPDETLNLKANEPLEWWPTSLHDCPLSVDVTAMYVSNSSGEAAKLDIEILHDPTP